jgi:hypothetical protein
MSDIHATEHKGDHDILIEIRVKLERLLGDVEGIKTTVTTNQESRLRALENFRWWIMGASMAISFLGGLVAHVVTR